MKTTGRYYKSLKAWINAGGNKNVVNCPCIHVSGSIKGMRRDFLGLQMRCCPGWAMDL